MSSAYASSSSSASLPSGGLRSPKEANCSSMLSSPALPIVSEAEVRNLEEMSNRRKACSASAAMSFSALKWTQDRLWEGEEKGLG